MSTNFEKFRTLLEELFQLDQADLDFGIYRIMNQKRDEVVRFLDKDLLPQVKEAFAHYQSADKAVLQKELDKLAQQIEAAGMNPSDSPRFRELQEQYDTAGFDATAVENEVFSHLYNFFRRYYHEGDFISLRRYKEGVYAIPYEGEEVKLHWANHDQYYVKSSEYFRDYIFTTPAGKRVHFALAAASSEQDNKKEAAGKERRFIICAQDPIYEENGELFIRFEYRPDDDKRKQDALNQEAIERVLNAEGFDEWKRELSKPAPTKANPKRTVLEKHLTQYTARNTFDYFIHKDLGGFLRRELDFYIKNEVMHLDDIEHDTVPRVEQYLSKIKVIRKIAHKIIQFLEQLENFQKKLWLKKKFVVETNYCITLDRVPEELYPEIAANDAQREEWVRLFAIDKIEKDLNGPGYSTPLTVDFLKNHQALPLDTKHFHRSFCETLLASMDEFEFDALCIHSSNSHALRLTQAAFQDTLDCIYIDPPYNTGGDGFIYKDHFQHSSWLSMTVESVRLSHSLLKERGYIFASIDDHEVSRLTTVFEDVYGPNNRVAIICHKSRSSVSNDLVISGNHNFLIAFAKDFSTAFRNKYEFGLEPLLDGFSNPDDDPRGPWKPMPTDGPGGGAKGNPHYTFMGVTGYFRYSPETMQQLYDDGELIVRGGTISRKNYLSVARDKRRQVTTWWDDVGTTTKGTKRLISLFGEKVFSNPKPVELVQRCVEVATTSNGVVLDFFAGSGTTIESVLSQNRHDSGSRTVVAIEVGSHFDEVLIPRMKKVVYTPDWRDGIPERPAQHRSFAAKYIRLESYEDALNNLELKRTDQQASLLEHDDDLREQYILAYMLDVESRGSQSLLNVGSFRNPDQYKLRVERNGETRLVNVDLVETFNWLLGLTVKHIDVIRGVRVVEGTTPDGDRTLVLWRNLDETDNNTLDNWFKKQKYNTRDQDYDLIYVNGDNNLENLRRGDQTWKVRLIEEEFGRLMFDVEDI